MSKDENRSFVIKPGFPRSPSINIYNIRLLPSTKDTYMKMDYKISGFLIICFKRNRWRNFI